MADYYVLDAEVRSAVGKRVKRVRNAGLVPATVYGPAIDPINIQIPYRPLEVALMNAGGTQLIEIKTGDGSYNVLARDVQRDVLKGTILHVDFFAVDITAKIQADIPLHLVNQSPPVAAREGILLTGPNSLTVETLPTKLMEYIEIDLSQLKAVGDSVLVRDLDLGDDIVIINDPEEMIVRVGQTSAARAALLESIDEEGEPSEAVAAEPEVIARGKAEEEEE